MPKIAIVQQNWTAGELSPRLMGRTDIAKYFNGADTLLNWIMSPYGDARARPGTYFVREVKDSSKVARLIPFQFSTEQAYQLEFGEGYIRFYKDGGIIVDEGGNPYEIVTEYETADIVEIQYAQDADVMYLAHPDYPPMKLSRYGHADWTIEEVEFVDGPYLDDNTTNIEITAAANTGIGIELTADGPGWLTGTAYNPGDYVSTGGTNYKCLIRHTSTTFATELSGGYWELGIAQVFKPGHVGGLWAYKDGWCKVMEYISPAKVKVDIKISFTGLSPAVRTLKTDWNEGAWSEENGYPSAVGFFEQRIMFASNYKKPQTSWGSYTQEIENYQAGADDSDAITYTLYSGQVNRIRWILGGRVLALGTSGGIFTMSGGANLDPLTPTNVTVRFETNYGSALIAPMKIGNYIYYVQRNGRKLREFSYQFEKDQFDAPDMTLLSDHILASGVVDTAYQQGGENIIWLVRADGVLVSMTRETQQDVTGWCRHILGGSFGLGNPVVESISVIPNDASGYDEVWLIVKRTINGVTKRYVEYITPIDYGADDRFQFFVDCGLTYNGTPISTITGADHLEGETVDVFADGAYIGEKVVSGGSIVLDQAASVVSLGLHYHSDLKTVRPEGGSAQGTSQSKIKRVYEVSLRLHKTGAIQVGKDFDNLDELSFRTPLDLMDTPVPLFSGDMPIHPNTGWNRDGQICIRRNTPVACTILCVILKVETND